MKPILPLVVLALAAVAVPQGWKPGDEAPKVSFVSPDGKRLFLKDLQNQGPFFLYFIRRDDPVSARMTTMVNRMIRAYTPARTKWYGVIDEGGSRMSSWVSENRPPYRVFADEDGTIRRAFKIESAPAIVMIDPEGKIVQEWAGYSGYWLKNLNSYLAQVNRTPMKKFDFSRTPSVTEHGRPF